MKINPKARIDRGRVRVRRGGGRSGGFPMPGGGTGGGSGGGSGFPIPTGGGVVGIVLVVILLIVLAQCNGGLPGTGGSSDTGSDEVANCESGADAAESEDCKLSLFVSSIERFWNEELPKQADVEYTDAQLQIFSGSTSSGCGQASSAMGPFYCPADKYVYIDSTFFDDMLEKELGAEGGDFAEAYVVAHEYGHHVQDLLGTMAKAQSRETGPTSPSVRLELQADCYAGVWAHYATTVKDANGEVFITDITDDDIRRAIDAATAVGDDRIQQRTQGHVNEEQWTHGSAEERVRWFTRGYEEGTLDACDTFSASAL
jgi:predicted metalloprotease